MKLSNTTKPRGKFDKRIAATYVTESNVLMLRTALIVNEAMRSIDYEKRRGLLIV